VSLRACFQEVFGDRERRQLCFDCVLDGGEELVTPWKLDACADDFPFLLLLLSAFLSPLLPASRAKHGVTEDSVAVPPLFKTALVWGLFMGVSSNIRYQTVFGLERLIDMTIARKIPQIAYVSTIGIRFANNVIGGENFIDMARWAGVQ
jgi:hypothetical protein